jgi:hypothetical protein
VIAVIGEILPLALVVTISPINIIAEILLLFSSKPVANASSYLVGFVTGVTVVLGAFVAIAGAVDLSPGSDPSKGAAALKLVLGVALLVAAVRKFRGRPRSDEEASMPKWMDGITGFAPGRSLAVGVAIGALNPKNLAVGLASALSIAAADLTTGQRLGSMAVYVFVAVLGVATPLVMTLVLGARANEVLEGWKTWLGRNNAVVMTVLFLVFGVVLVGQGVAAL